MTYLNMNIGIIFYINVVKFIFFILQYNFVEPRRYATSRAEIYDCSTASARRLADVPTHFLFVQYFFACTHIHSFYFRFTLITCCHVRAMNKKKCLPIVSTFQNLLIYEIATKIIRKHIKTYLHYYYKSMLMHDIVQSYKNVQKLCISVYIGSIILCKRFSQMEGFFSNQFMKEN